MGLKLLVGDHVIVLTGRDKGKTGKIIKVVKVIKKQKKKAVVLKALVSGVNIYKKIVRSKISGQSSIVDAEFPISVSNIAFYDSERRIQSKVGFKVVDGKKMRFLKSSGKVIG